MAICRLKGQTLAPKRRTFFEDITDKLALPIEEILKSEKITWYLILNDFNLPIGFPRNIEYDSGPCLELKTNDIIGVASMLYTDRRDKKINICLFDGKINSFGSSAQFFHDNTINKVLFENITLQINRNKKLNQII